MSDTSHANSTTRSTAASMCNDYVCSNFAEKKGLLKCLIYSHESHPGMEYVWDRNTTFIACFNGHLECLQYAHENGCPWHPKTTYVAAFNGHLKCLQYAHENGCEWDPNTIRAAALYGHLECLMYIYENCGDVATWENANLDENCGYLEPQDRLNLDEDFSKEIQDFIKSVRDDWKCGLNCPGMRTKSAKRN